MSRCPPGIALLTLLAFGCTTVRVDASRLGEADDAPGTMAAPMVELVLESARPVPPAQSAQAAAQARGAIAQALQDVQVSRSAMGAWDAVLFVRERGVAQTSSLKTDQNLARVAIAAGIVVLIAAVVVLVVASGKHGGVAHAAHLAPHHPVHVAPPVHRQAPVYFNLSFSIWDEPPYLPAPLLAYEHLDLRQGPPPPDDWTPPRPLLPYLQPPATFVVEERGYFTGPQMALQFDLADRATGEVLWTRTVASDGNPCDAGDVRELVVAALDGTSWASLSPDSGRRSGRPE
jgi:hypothetical protein